MCLLSPETERKRATGDIHPLSQAFQHCFFFLLVIDICAVNGNNFLLFSILPVHASTSDLHTMSFGFVGINKCAIFVQKEFTFA